MKRLKANNHTLHVLKDSNPCVRKAILKGGSDDLIKTLCEICLNVLNGNVKISKKCKTVLNKNKNTLRYLATSHQPISKKRKILVQKGGFLPIILEGILSGLAGKVLEEITK
jgi:hypothetical protein